MKNLQDLINQLQGEDQNYKTRCGWVEYNGQRMYVRKHWSYSGGWPAYTDETTTTCIGEFRGDGENSKVHTIYNGVRKNYSSYSEACKDKERGEILFDTPLLFVSENEKN